MPATYDMGKNHNATLKHSSSKKWWAMGIINNAACDWFKFCEDNDITKPSDDLRIWCLSYGVGGASVMLHHGMFNHTNVGKVLSFLAACSNDPHIIIGDLALKALIQLVGPDLVICDIDDSSDPRNIYETTLTGHSPLERKC